MEGFPYVLSGNDMARFCFYYDCISVYRGTPDFQRCDRMIQAQFPKATFQGPREPALLENL